MGAKNSGPFDGTGYGNGDFSRCQNSDDHRDPVSTVPSYCSMESTLYRMGSEEITHAMVGEYWFERLSQWTDSFMSVRSSHQRKDLWM